MKKIEFSCVEHREDVKFKTEVNKTVTEGKFRLKTKKILSKSMTELFPH